MNLLIHIFLLTVPMKIKIKVKTFDKMSGLHLQYIAIMIQLSKKKINTGKKTFIVY